jgi:hypothetical protein
MHVSMIVCYFERVILICLSAQRVVGLGGKLQMMKRQVAVLQPRNILHVEY